MLFHRTTAANHASRSVARPLGLPPLGRLRTLRRAGRRPPERRTSGPTLPSRNGRTGDRNPGRWQDAGQLTAPPARLTVTALLEAL
ncbi:hypothetical protein CG747_04810 [Streptomyces sp. CB02959]|nr:hypothetical protein CG747_04810 [Streptomyces sp. CB02959]